MIFKGTIFRFLSTQFRTSFTDYCTMHVATVSNCQSTRFTSAELFIVKTFFAGWNFTLTNVGKMCTSLASVAFLTEYRTFFLLSKTYIFLVGLRLPLAISLFVRITRCAYTRELSSPNDLLTIRLTLITRQSKLCWSPLAHWYCYLHTNVPEA